MCDKKLLNDFAIICGDSRLFYLAKFLHNRKFKVIGFNLFNLKNDKFDFQITNSLEKAIKTSTCVVGPMPFSRDDDLINCECNLGNCKISSLLEYLNEKHLFLAGNLSECILNSLKKKTKFVYDYYKNENFLVFNSMLTAEAAVAEIVLQKSNYLGFCNCLVLGFGRCGKLIALKLKNFCKNITICSKNELDLIWSKALGFEIVRLEKLEYMLKKFDVIVNTVPFNILKGDLLKKLKNDVFVFDITSNGINLNEFKKASIQAKVSLQIPGKFKFKSSAKYLSNLFIQILEQHKKFN